MCQENSLWAETINTEQPTPRPANKIIGFLKKGKKKLSGQPGKGRTSYRRERKFYFCQKCLLYRSVLKENGVMYLIYSRKAMKIQDFISNKLAVKYKGHNKLL